MGECESGDHNSFGSGNSFYQNPDNKKETSQREATRKNQDKPNQCKLEELEEKKVKFKIAKYVSPRE